MKMQTRFRARQFVAAAVCLVLAGLLATSTSLVASAANPQIQVDGFHGELFDGDPNQPTAGQTVYWEISIENTGWEDVIIWDTIPYEPMSSVKCGGMTIPVRRTIYCSGFSRLTQEDIDAGYTAITVDFAFADPDANFIDWYGFSGYLGLVEREPIFGVTVSPEVFQEGTVLTFTYTFSNEENPWDIDLYIGLDYFSGWLAKPFWENFPLTTKLQAGSTATFTVPYTATMEDVLAGGIEHIAWAYDKSGGGLKTVEYHKLFVPAVEPDFVITLDGHLPDPAKPMAGDLVQWSLAIENLDPSWGLPRLAGLTGIDLDPTTCSAGMLDGYGRIDCTGTSKLTQRDIDGGSVSVGATVEVLYPERSRREKEIHPTEIPALPKAELVNHEPNGELAGIAPMSLGNGQAGAPSEQFALPAKADNVGDNVGDKKTDKDEPGNIEALFIRNQAAVSLELAQVPALDFTVSLSNAVYNQGTPLAYAFKATNTGNVTLSNVKLEALAFTGTGGIAALSGLPASASQLAPGHSYTGNTLHVATASDVTRGSVNQKARVIAATPKGTLIQADASKRAVANLVGFAPTERDESASGTTPGKNPPESDYLAEIRRMPSNEAPASSGVSRTGGTKGSLPRTGNDSSTLALAALCLALTGGALIARTRRTSGVNS